MYVHVNQKWYASIGKPSLASAVVGSEARAQAAPARRKPSSGGAAARCRPALQPGDPDQNARLLAGVWVWAWVGGGGVDVCGVVTEVDGACRTFQR